MQLHLRVSNYDKLFNRDPTVIRIYGEIYHNSYALHPNNNVNRKYGQLFIMKKPINVGLMKVLHLQLKY